MMTFRIDFIPSSNAFHMEFSDIQKKTFTMEMGIVSSGGAPHYRGETTITPKAFAEQVLKTQGKYVEQDITIQKVPYWETSNTDGLTVYIADRM